MPSQLEANKAYGTGSFVTWLISRKVAPHIRFSIVRTKLEPARYVRSSDPSRAEIALAVLDDYQGSGIGPLLIHHLAGIARANGVQTFEANVLGDNDRMLKVP